MTGLQTWPPSTLIIWLIWLLCSLALLSVDTTLVSRLIFAPWPWPLIAPSYLFAFVSAFFDPVFGLRLRSQSVCLNKIPIALTSAVCPNPPTGDSKIDWKVVPVKTRLLLSKAAPDAFSSPPVILFTRYELCKSLKDKNRRSNGNKLTNKPLWIKHPHNPKPMIRVNYCDMKIWYPHA